MNIKAASRGLAQSILCCPDCEADLNSDLACAFCARSLAPGEDGIISALPLALQNGNKDKETLKEVVDSSASAESIVRYEQLFHDEQANYYDKLFADPLPLRTYYQSLVRKQVYPCLKGTPLLVDLCCGTGKSSLPLAQLGIPIVAIDISREMLRAYKKKSGESNCGNVIFVHADASCPPLRNRSCPAITVMGGLHHIPEQERCIERCCRSLKENGLFILHEPLKTGKTSRVASFLENLYAISDFRRAWRAMARRLGFKSDRSSVARQSPALEFTPFEKPFRSAEEFLTLIPGCMKVLSIRSQGLLSFHEFSAAFQGYIGLPFAILVVALDGWMSRRAKESWSGDALFAVLKKVA